MKLESKDMVNEDISWANEILDLLGSNHDLVMVGHQIPFESTISELSMNTYANLSIHEVLITYMDAEGFMVNGTVADMILDRLKTISDVEDHQLFDRSAQLLGGKK